MSRALLLLGSASGLSASHQYSTSVYWKQQSTVDDVDQGAFLSSEFWAEVDKELPGWRSKPELERFRGFCENLKTAPPGEDFFLDNGQQLLSQYIYPGLSDGDEAATEGTPLRQAYPVDDFEELQELKIRLERDIAPLARRELAQLLEARPLVSDEEEEPDFHRPRGVEEKEVTIEADETWQRAAWYGWQFLSMRGARKFMPETTAALRLAMGGELNLGPAHRFVGLARQKAQCRGTSHSDGRNYLISTLTPVQAPLDKCGIIVDGKEAAIYTGGPAVILDNTFAHHVFNDAETDRFCLIAECWHPALSAPEREALSTLFAVKDRFTVLNLKMAPWGYAEEDLAEAMRTGAINDLNSFKEVGYDATSRPAPKKPKVAAASATPGFKSSKTAKKKGFGSATKKVSAKAR